MSHTSRAVEDILDVLQETAEENDNVSVEDMVSAIGNRGWGPLLFVPALVVISPLGGVPGVASLMAAIIALFAIQIVLGRDGVWMPGVIARRSVSGDRIEGAVEKVRPVGAWLDRWFHGRLSFLTSDMMIRVAAGVAVALCATVPPLELIPFAGLAPMSAIAMFGLALTLRDGVLMLFGFLLSCVTLATGTGLI